MYPARRCWCFKLGNIGHSNVQHELILRDKKS
jgi:hypothetical protein